MAEKDSYTVIGLMSGTSVDSVDATALTVELEKEKTILKTIGSITYTIGECLRKEIFELFEDPAGSLERLAVLNIRLGYLFSEAALELLRSTGLKAKDVYVIGSHGQTIFHVAEPAELCGKSVRGSIQIGEGSVIAQSTGIPVVSDFRTADIAAGGSGAPLVPFLDLILFGNLGKTIAAQNIGGIGNVTWIPGREGSVIAFDTGPGNMIIDRLVEIFTGGKSKYDRDGRIGRGGTVLQEVLERWMKHPYFKKRPPKTTGREEFGSSFLNGILDLSAVQRVDADLIRTAEEFTACSIAESYRRFLPELPETVIVTGGGAHNPIIMESLRKLLPQCMVVTGEEYGINSDFKEAAAFALMALWTMLGRPNNVPEATGASCPVIMGKLSFP